MKNIHIIPTDKPSRLILQDTELVLSKYMEVNEGFSEFNQHIYITSDEKIKADGEWYYNTITNAIFQMKYLTEYDLEQDKKIILTTDPSLAPDVYKIDDEFLEWFVKNPSCEEVEVVYDYFQVDQNNPVLRGSTSLVKQHKIIIPKEEPKQIKCYCGHTTYCDCSPLEEPKQETTLEEAAEKASDREGFVDGALFGAKWQQEQDKNKYSEEDMKEAFNNGRDMLSWSDVGVEMKYNTFNDWFEQFKKKKLKGVI